MSSTVTAPPSSPAIAQLFHPSNFINGAWLTDADGTFNTVVDKYHGTELAKIPHATEAQMEEAIAAAQAGMDMIGTAFTPERAHFAKAVPETHFQFGLPWGKNVPGRRCNGAPES